MRSKSAEPMAQLWPACSIIRRRWLTARALSISSGRCCRRRLTSRSSGRLMTVSIRSARPSIEILLDAGVLVAKVDPDVGAGGEDPGLVAMVCRAPELSGEDHEDLFGAADPDVVGHERFEEAACAASRLGASRVPTSIRRHDPRWSAASGSR